MRYSNWIPIVFLITSFMVSGQTTIVLEAGPISYNNLDTDVQDSYVTDISDCTSIQFSLEFNFSDPWLGPGMGDRMEAADQCAIGTGTCPGDPQNPQASGCSNCWDFMWSQFLIGNSEVENQLLGLDLNTPQFGIITSSIYCTDGETEAEIRITNQNWASHETNTFENVTILCWEGVPSITTNSPLTCSGQNLDLIGDATDVSVVTDWMWDNDMNGSIDDDEAQVTFATGAEDGEMYTLEATDINGCDGTAEVVISTGSSFCLLYTSPSPRDGLLSRMPSSA